MNYLVYAPMSSKAGNLPMVVFLHGAGERGGNISHLYRHGIPKMLSEGRKYPAIILIPQCYESFTWSNVVRELFAVIDSVADEFNVDKNRISVTGGSMGGFGTWEMGMNYHSYFSAIAPVCGGGMSWRAPNLKELSVFVYHGSEDDCVPIAYSELMVNALKAVGCKVEFNVLQGMGHNDAIDYVYRRTDVIEKLIGCVRISNSSIVETFSEHF